MKDFIKRRFRDIVILFLLLSLVGGMVTPVLADVARIQAPPSLTDLLDVNATSPSDDDSLTWDTATGKWIPEAVAGGGGGGIGDADGDTKIQTEESADEDKIRFDTGGTERVIIDDSGNVGIGTATPNAPLEVKGAKPGPVGGFQSGMLHVTGSGTAEFYNAVITGHNAYNTNTQLWYFGSTSSGNNDIGFLNRQNAAIHFYTNNTFRMAIDAAGDVGIGTPTPSELLDVDGNIAVSGTVDGVDVSALDAAVVKIADLENPPTEDEASKAPTSDWAFDHEHDDSIHTSITTATITLYVDAGSGSDENVGTSGSPKATILGALDALPTIIAHAATICVRGQQNYAESNVALEFSRFNTLAGIVIKAVNSNDENMYDVGKATSGGANYLDDSGGGWATDQFNSAFIWIREGTGAGQIRTILDTTGTRITTTANWATNPDNTSYYVVGGGATMTGTSAYHVSVIGKIVSIYGFAHTGHTGYAVRHNAFASGNAMYNYSSVKGLAVISGWSASNPYYNYCSGTFSYGIVLGATASSACRSNVVTGKTSAGIWCYRSSIAVGSGVAGGKNFLFSNPGRGIYVSDGAGFMGATVQGYGVGGEVNGTNYETDTGTTSWVS